MSLPEIEFSFAHPFHLAAGILAVGIGLRLAFKSADLLQDAGRRRILVGLRMAALVLFAGLFFEPSLVFKKTEKHRRALDLLVDASPSMRAGKGGLSLAEEFMRDHAAEFQSLSGVFDVRAWAFSADTLLDSMGGFPVTTLSRFSGATRLSDGLEALVERRPAALVLFSDGMFKDKFSSRQGLGLKLLDPDDPLRAIPVHPVVQDTIAPGPDLAVSGVAADEFAYAKNVFTAEVRLRARGHPALKVPVRLLRGNEAVASREVQIKPGQDEYTVRLDFVPEEVGYFIYTVAIPEYGFEHETRNNRRPFSLKVIRDRIRVLHVCGRPSWDGKFLRQTLKIDPAVDLVAFYILRTVSDVVNVPNSELSLIEFPYQQLFDQELKTFDLVIFQNFSYRTFFPPEYMANIRRYVEEGGAFLMLGGDLSFSEGGFRGTAIDGLLPFKLDAPEPGSLQSAFRARRTAAGKSHPVTGDLSGLEGFAFEGLNRLGPPENNAVTLAETGEGRPFVGLREAGRGRTAAVAGDGLWQYHFVSAGSGQGNRDYQELVRRLVRWLVKDPALGAVSIAGLKGEYPPGAAVHFGVRLSGRPGERTLKVRVLDAASRVAAESRIKASEKETAPVEFKNPGPGRYIVRAELVRDGMVQDFATESFGVSGEEEFGDAAQGRALLSQLAAETGGRVLTGSLRDLPGALRADGRPEVRITERRAAAIWNGKWSVVLLIFVFALEWFLRKRQGLP